jgi:hypothetical protein
VNCAMSTAVTDAAVTAAAAVSPPSTTAMLCCATHLPSGPTSSSCTSSVCRSKSAVSTHWSMRRFTATAQQPHAGVSDDRQAHTQQESIQTAQRQ